MYVTVSKNISSIIAERGLRKSFVAQRSGFTAQQFSDMLQGRKLIRIEYLPRIADALGVSIPELYNHSA